MPETADILALVLDRVVRPHLVGPVDHDCAAEIARDLDGWRRRLLDGTACAACEGTGVAGGRRPEDCAACGGSGERRG